MCSDWKPIASAPKDGTPFDAWIIPPESSYLHKAPFRAANARFDTDRGGAWLVDEHWNVLDWQEHGKQYASHWRPLPSPPSAPRDADPRPGSVEHDAAKHRAREQADAAGESDAAWLKRCIDRLDEICSTFLRARKEPVTARRLEDWSADVGGIARALGSLWLARRTTALDAPAAAGWVTEAEWPAFKPCAVDYPEGGMTEFVQADVSIVWEPVRDGIEAGYDMADRTRLVAVRWPISRRTTPPDAPAAAGRATEVDSYGTDDLIERFGEAVKQKLRAASAKYGWTANWQRADWQVECVAELVRHVTKGDPRDVAAYCAFAWHHGWPTALDTGQAGGPGA